MPVHRGTALSGPLVKDLVQRNPRLKFFQLAIGRAGTYTQFQRTRAPDDRYGNAGVGVVRGPGKQIVDISARKALRLSERFTLRIQADFFNTFNIRNFGNPSVSVTDVAYGRISTADPGRNIQLDTRLTF